MSPMVKVGTGLFVILGLAVGSYGIKLLLEYELPYTLEYVAEYKTGDKKDKFGGKFSRYLISGEERHMVHNRSHWNAKVASLAKATDDLGGDSGKEAHNKAKTGESEKTEEKRKEAVGELIKVCKCAYEDTTVEEPSNEKKEGGTAVGAYCSIDGRSHGPKKKQ